MSKKNFLNQFLSQKEIDELLSDIPAKRRVSFLEFLKNEYRKALSKPPNIAFIGRTGVGKSSTLNALFNAGLKVHNTRPSTKKPKIIRVETVKKRGKGVLHFYDMPGVGESKKMDKKHLETYKKVLADCDLAVWVLSEDDRDLAFDEQFIEQFIDNNNLGLASRLVIGINKVDRIEPNNWNNKYNLPSREQEHAISDRVAYVREVLGRVLPEITKDRVVAYSAKQHYRLAELFEAMLKATPKKHVWYLNNMKEIAKYLDKVDQGISIDPYTEEQLNVLRRGQYYESFR